MTDAGDRLIEVTVDRIEGGWVCAVTITDRGGPTLHRVTVDDAVLARLAPGAADPRRLVQASFEFLLEREPKESILRSFDLPVIGRYFPEYEREIRRRSGHSGATEGV